MTLAFLFPGQGSQSVGMGRALAAEHTAARQAFEIADRVLGFALSRLCWEGPEDELRLTKNAQPALLAHSVAALRVLESHGVTPAATAGHSLGEHSACVAAGALAYEDALRLVRSRGELMFEAGRARPGTMAAVLGLEPAAVEAACIAASGDGLEVVAANYNAPGQIVISGDVEAVARAGEIAKHKGARRVIPLPVSGAFHSPLMRPAAERLARAIAAVEVRAPRCPVIGNARAERIESAAALRAALEAQLTQPVRWEASMRLLLADAPAWFIEVGTGRVLCGLLKSVAPEAAAISLTAGEPADLALALERLGAARPSAAREIR